VGKEQSFQQAQEGVGQTLSQNKALREQRAQETTVTHAPKDEQVRLEKEKTKKHKRKRKKLRRKPSPSNPSKIDQSQKRTSVDIVV
jgi:hypothetical protein